MHTQGEHTRANKISREKDRIPIRPFHDDSILSLHGVHCCADSPSFCRLNPRLAVYSRIVHHFCDSDSPLAKWRREWAPTQQLSAWEGLSTKHSVRIRTFCYLDPLKAKLKLRLELKGKTAPSLRSGLGGMGKWRGAGEGEGGTTGVGM